MDPYVAHQPHILGVKEQIPGYIPVHIPSDVIGYVQLAIDSAKSHDHSGHSHVSKFALLNTHGLGAKVFKYTPELNTFLAISVITLTTQLLITACPQLNGTALNFFVSFAAGSMLGDIFLHMLHEIEINETTGLVIIAGFLTFVFIHKFIGHEHSHEDSHKSHKEGHEHKESTFGWVNALADALHNVADGISLAFAFKRSPEAGFLFFVIMCCHEIPHQFGDFAVLIQSGVSRSRAATFQLLTAMGTALGASICLGSSSATYLQSLLETYATPFTMGVLLYVLGLGIFPELLHSSNKNSKLSEAVVMALGIGLGLGFLAVLH